MSNRILLLAAACAALVPSLAHADVIVNGNFETGNLSGWSGLGSGHAADATIGVTPTEGTYQAYIETTGNYSAAATDVDAAMGVDDATVVALGAGPPTNGTGMWQNITVAAGDTLSFDWNFLTDELDEDPIYNDFGFFTISGSAFLLASRGGSTYDMVSPPAGFDGQTGWATQSYTFSSAGTYTLGFAVYNVGDAGHNSVLLLDNISIPVPEPSSIVLLATGFAAVMLGRRRRLFAG